MSTGTRTAVVGVDGTPQSTAALEWALRFAAESGWRLRCVTAYDVQQVTVPAMPMTVTPFEDPAVAQEQAELTLASAVFRARHEVPEATGVPLTEEVVPGRPGQVLVDLSAEADLLVLSSHGHSRLFEAVLGSTSGWCVRHAHCPVVVLPPRSEHLEQHRAGR